ncbi:sulfite exporter TauE/SafE family protein [Thalassotalea fusca]
MFFTVFSIFLVVGCLIGFLAGLLGIGGGLLIVPILVYVLPLFKVDAALVMPIALATSLASIVFTATSATWAHHKNANIPWKTAKPLAVVMALGALIGAKIADSLPSDLLRGIFATAVILLAAYMLLSIRVHKTKPLPDIWVLRAIGIFTGFLSSLMGISGGAILVPTLTYYSMSIRLAIGTATVCGFVVATFGALGFVLTGLDQDNLPPWSVGYIYLPALLGMVTTSFVFAPLGVKWAAKLPVRTLKKCFAAFLILVAVRMFWQ